MKNTQEHDRVMYFNEHYLEKIIAILDDLGEAERSAAQYIMDHKSDCADMTIKELAQACGCSTASVVRLCKNLGYSGFAELKFQIQHDAAVQTKESLAISQKDDPNSLKQKTLQFVQSSLEITVQNIGDAALQQASDALSKAGRVLFSATGSACGAALAGVYYLTNAGINALFPQDDLLQLRTVASFRPGDVVIGINYGGHAKSVADTMMVAKLHRVTTILITSARDGFLEEYADIVLNTPIRTTDSSLHLSTTALCQMMVMHLLIMGVWQRGGEARDRQSAQVRGYSQLKQYHPIQKKLRIEPVTQ